MNTPRLMAWIKRNCTNARVYNTQAYATYLGRRIRVTDNKLQVGDVDFDRWANSVAYTAYLDGNGNIAIQMGKAIVAASQCDRPLEIRVVEKMKQVYNSIHNHKGTLR